MTIDSQLDFKTVSKFYVLRPVVKSEFAKELQNPRCHTTKLQVFKRIVKYSKNLINIIRRIEKDDCISFVGEGGGG